MKAAVLVCASLVTGLIAFGQDLSYQELARLLSDDATQKDAIAKIVAAGTAKVPLLLSWTTKPPAGLERMDDYFLDIALCEIFGQLRTREAIPFLIKNISLHRLWWTPSTVWWLRYPETVLEAMPAIAALVSIGPEALPRVIEDVTRVPLDPEQSYEGYLAAVFVVPRIAVTAEDKKKARDFLSSVLMASKALPQGGATELARWVRDGYSVLAWERQR